MEAGFVYPRCAHEQQEIRLRDVAGAPPRWVLQCLNCGSQLHSVKRGRVPLRCLAQPVRFDESLSERYREAINADYLRWKQRKNQTWWEQYDAYLRTPQWRARRAAVLEREAGLCQGCGAARATQVHHLTYQHLGRELLFELVAVCDRCHELCHSVSEGSAEDENDEDNEIS